MNHAWLIWFWDVGLHSQALDLRFDYNQRVRVEVKILTFSSFADRASLRQDSILFWPRDRCWPRSWMRSCSAPGASSTVSGTCHLSFVRFHSFRHLAYVSRLYQTPSGDQGLYILTCERETASFCYILLAFGSTLRLVPVIYIPSGIARCLERSQPISSFSDLCYRARLILRYLLLLPTEWLSVFFYLQRPQDPQVWTYCLTSSGATLQQPEWGRLRLKFCKGFCSSEAYEHLRMHHLGAWLRDQCHLLPVIRFSYWAWPLRSEGTWLWWQWWHIGDIMNEVLLGFELCSPAFRTLEDLFPFRLPFVCAIH